ncbi:MAG: hypothetical protein AB2392_13005 [Neobacillus sp.]
METNTSIIHSINNVRHLINNAIFMLRDQDAALSRHGFVPLYGNALGTESSKSINQSINQYATFFPQYIARPYALESELNQNQVNKIIFTNIQFFHVDYEELTPTLVNSVMIFPESNKNVKGYVQNWWLKYTAFEEVAFDEINKNGEFNESVDKDGVKTIFWCRDLMEINGQKELQEEVERLVGVFGEN